MMPAASSSLASGTCGLQCYVQCRLQCCSGARKASAYEIVFGVGLIKICWSPAPPRLEYRMWPASTCAPDTVSSLRLLFQLLRFAPASCCLAPERSRLGLAGMHGFVGSHSGPQMQAFVLCRSGRCMRECQFPVLWEHNTGLARAENENTVARDSYASPADSTPYSLAPYLVSSES